jgi:hypothetical protein
MFKKHGRAKGQNGIEMEYKKYEENEKIEALEDITGKILEI